jgi:uncharacterized phage protein gp47/JayE
VLRRFQARPQGGAFADYDEWARITGIVGVYPYKSDTPGEVDVYVLATEESSGDPDGVPTGAQLTAVAAAIELDDEGLASQRPVNAAVNVLATTRSGFDVTFTGLDADDVDAAKAAVEEAVDEYLRTLEPFIQGLSVLPRKDRVTQGAVAGVANDAVEAVGGTIANVTLQLSGSTITAYTLGRGELAKLGTPTYA